MRELLELAVPPYEGPAGRWNDVVHEAGAVRRRRRAWVLRPVAGLGVVALVAVVAWALSGAPPSTLDRALAATGDGHVLHLVFESDLPRTVVNLRTGERTEMRGRHDVWFDPAAGVRETETFEGAVQWDVSSDVAGIHEHQREIYTSLGAGYREALRSGKAKVVGEGDVAGQAVVWIRITPGGRAHDVAVSRKTYEPVYLRIRGAGGTRILAYETLSSAPLQAKSLPPSRPVGKPGGATTLRAAADTFGHPPVWAGEAFDGLRLTEVRSLDLDGDVRGVSLLYGTTDGAHVEITQAPKLADGLTMPAGVRGYAPPDGTLILEGPSGVLRSNGLVVGIHAPDEETAIAVARALQPYD